MNILEELRKKIADIETQSLAMDGCRPTFTVSEIMDLIDSVETDKQTAESAQNVPNDDLISRKAAIDALDCINGVEEVLRALPSAQPDHLREPTKMMERETGRWVILRNEYGDIVEAVCSNCHMNGRHEWAYCPHCGADMRGDKHEAD